MLRAVKKISTRKPKVAFPEIITIVAGSLRNGDTLLSTSGITLNRKARDSDASHISCAFSFPATAKAEGTQPFKF